MATATATRPATTRTVTVKVTKPDITKPVTKQDAVDCTKPNNSVPTAWRDMQTLAKSLGIKAGGRGVTTSTLHGWLQCYAKHGSVEMLFSLYPEAQPGYDEATKTVKKSSSKKSTGTKAVKEPKADPFVGTALEGLKFRDAQRVVKDTVEALNIKGLKASIKRLGLKATTSQGLADITHYCSAVMHHLARVETSPQLALKVCEAKWEVGHTV